MFKESRVGRSAASIALAAACAAGALWVGVASAAAPGIDPGYGEGGILRTESQVPAGYKEGREGGRGLAGANGSVLYVSELSACTDPGGSGCRFSLMVRRFTPSGFLDGTYGESGVLNLDTPDRSGSHLEATDPRGRLYAAEVADGTVSLRRFTARGRLDAKFGAAGKVALGRFANGARPVAILMVPGERLVVAVAESTEGEYAHAGDRVTMVRLLPDGRVDRSFGKKGRAVVGVPSAYGVRAYETPKGATLVVGQNCCSADDFTPVHRVSAAGKVDVRFNAQERRSQVKALANFAEPEIASVVPRTDGTIELFGSSKAAADPGGPGYLLRLKADGSLEERFGSGGVVTLAPNLADAEAGPGGSSLVSFRSYVPQTEPRARIERLLSDGRPDPRLGGEAGIEVPVPGGEARLVPPAGGEALALVSGVKNCQTYCEPSPYFMRLIEPSGGSAAGEGGKH